MEASSVLSVCLVCWFLGESSATHPGDLVCLFVWLFVPGWVTSGPPSRPTLAVRRVGRRRSPFLILRASVRVAPWSRMVVPWSRRSRVVFSPVLISKSGCGYCQAGTCEVYWRRIGSSSSICNTVGMHNVSSLLYPTMSVCTTCVICIV